MMQAAVAAGTIRLDISLLGLRLMRARATSAIHSIAGLDWYIEAELTEQRVLPFDGIVDLKVNVHCNSEGAGWGCEADINFQIVTDGNLLGSGTITETFPTGDNSAPRHVWNNIFNSFDLARQCDGVVIEATVTVKNVVGVQDVSTAHSLTSLVDFSIPHPDIPIVALVIGEKRVYVSKELLAVHSPVFLAMFFSEFVEKNKKEIPLEDLDFDEFVEFLHVVYPSRKPVAAATIDCLLSLGDRFNAEVVMRECEAFLCGPAGNELPLEKKLHYADRFGLSRLQILSFDSITTFNEAKMLHGKKEFGELSDKMRSSLLERILKLR